MGVLAGVVDEDVDRSVRQDSIGDLVRTTILREISRRELRRAAGITNGGNDLLGASTISSVHDREDLLRCQELHDRLAQARCRSRHQRTLACKFQIHGVELQCEAIPGQTPESATI